MKKIALVFLLAVFVPSLVLAWLAVRSLRDQQLVLERQQTLLYQGVADGLVKDANLLADRQNEFVQQVEALLATHPASDLATTFDDRLRATWPAAEVGFVVTDSGKLSCPSPYGGPTARTFYAENGKFVCNIQSAEVYWSPKVAGNFKNNSQSQQIRNVMPQQQSAASAEDFSQNYSKAAPAEAEFRQLVGDSSEGTVARFSENKLKVLLWYRARQRPGPHLRRATRHGQAQGGPCPGRATI